MFTFRAPHGVGLPNPFPLLCGVLAVTRPPSPVFLSLSEYSISLLLVIFNEISPETVTNIKRYICARLSLELVTRGVIYYYHERVDALKLRKLGYNAYYLQ